MIMIKGCRSSFLLTASFMGSKNKLGLSTLGMSNYSRGGGREEGFFVKLKSLILGLIFFNLVSANGRDEAGSQGTQWM